MQFGVSYFGVRHPQHFQRDLEEIARLGFTSIIFTFSEEDHRFYQGTLHVGSSAFHRGPGWRRNRRSHDR